MEDKPNGVQVTPSPEGTVRSEGKDNRRGKAYNSPQCSKSTWECIRVEFESGSYNTLKELGEKYGVSHGAIRKKVCREKWNERQRTLKDKVSQVIEKKVLKEVSEADSYLKRSFLRSQKYEQMLEASVSQMATNEKGVPLVDPDALDTLSRSEARIHEWAKSCLRIIPVSQIDHTSNGESLGQSFVSAISKLREAKDTPRLAGGDLDKVLEAEVE